MFYNKKLDWIDDSEEVIAEEFEVHFKDSPMRKVGEMINLCILILIGPRFSKLFITKHIDFSFYS